MKVILCDNRIEGHHKLYFSALLELKYTKLKYIQLDLISIKKNFFRYFLSRRELIKEFLKNNEGNDNVIIHFLTLDFIYSYIFFTRKVNVIGTLHHIPKSLIKKILLKIFSKKIRIIIVHSEFLKENLKKMGIKNVKVVNYPSFYDYSKINMKKELRIKNKIDSKKIILSCLGGTRKDKGLNILLESLKYIKKDIKEKLLINIVGKEEEFKKEYIEKELKDISNRIILEKVSDDEFMENILITDLMIMPYLKSFGGVSGPMTEAIVNKIPCIAPKELEIGKIIVKNNMGEIFTCEDPIDLARVIEKTISKIDEYYDTDYYKELTKENFLKKYDEIYKDFL
ncbi:glycosyltransferase family 4 protein [Fusobacterium varium]|uniref:glycosyltransferase family 4 protein n=1 Tax=Fusobacterium varium TaxID=856 RepID=UPI0035681F82